MRPFKDKVHIFLPQGIFIRENYNKDLKTDKENTLIKMETSTKETGLMEKE